MKISKIRQRMIIAILAITLVGCTTKSQIQLIQTPSPIKIDPSLLVPPPPLALMKESKNKTSTQKDLSDFIDTVSENYNQYNLNRAQTLLLIKTIEEHNKLVEKNQQKRTQ